MTYLEATGAPLECARCGRAAPPDEADRSDWGGLMMNGRLVQLACPGCLTADEREQVAQRLGASLWEVASARRVDLAALSRLATVNRARRKPAPSVEWLATLAPGAEHIGLVGAEPDADELLCVWACRAADGRHLGTAFPVPIAAWMELEEVYVPYTLQAWARELVA